MALRSAQETASVARASQPAQAQASASASATRPHSKWTPEQNLELVRLKVEGRSQSDIAELLGRTARSIEHRTTRVWDQLAAAKQAAAQGAALRPSAEIGHAPPQAAVTAAATTQQPAEVAPEVIKRPRGRPPKSASLKAAIAAAANGKPAAKPKPAGPAPGVAKRPVGRPPKSASLKVAIAAAANGKPAVKPARPAGPAPGVAKRPVGRPPKSASLKAASAAANGKPAAKPAGAAAAAAARRVRLRLLVPVPESPAVVTDSDLWLVVAHLDLPLGGGGAGGAAAGLAAHGLGGGLADDDAPLADAYGTGSHRQAPAPGAGYSGPREALIRLLQPPSAPGRAPRGGGGASSSSCCVLLQPPYLGVIRHWTSVMQSIGSADEDALPLELRPRLQACRTALRHCAGHAPALRPPPSHVRLRLLWLGDSIVSDLDGTGKLSWAHACNWHDCDNLGLSGETAGGLLERVADAGTESVAGGRRPRGAARGCDAVRTEAHKTRVAFGAAAEGPAPVVILHSGNNDLAFETPAAIAYRLQKVVSAVRQLLPGSRILLLGLFASRRVKPSRRDSILKLNRLLELMPAQLAATGAASLEYVDLSATLGCRGFGAPDCLVPEEAMTDSVHLNALGCHAIILAVLERVSAAEDGPALGAEEE